jgi:hypothetical protein
MPRGASVPTLTPHHSGTVQPRKGGPLWLQHQAYGYLLTLCQDHARVSATAVLVSTRTRFPPQVRQHAVTAPPPMDRPVDQGDLSPLLVGLLPRRGRIYRRGRPLPRWVRGSL